MKPHLPLALRAVLLPSAAALTVFASSAFAVNNEASGTYDPAIVNPFLDTLKYAQWVRNAGNTGGYELDSSTSAHVIESGPGNAVIQFTSNGNVGTPMNLSGINIALETTDTEGAANNSGQMTVNGAINADSVWFRGGSYLVINNSTPLANAGHLYVQGGQLHFFVIGAGGTTISNAVTLGTSNYDSQTAAYSGASLRLTTNTTFSNKVTVAQNTKIAYISGVSLALSGGLSLATGATITFGKYGEGNNLALSLRGTLQLTGDGSKETGISSSGLEGITLSGNVLIDLSEYTGTVADEQTLSNFQLGNYTDATEYTVTGLQQQQGYISFENGVATFHEAGVHEDALRWNLAGSGAWNTTTTNWRAPNGNPVAFSDGSEVVFSGTEGTITLTQGTTLSPGKTDVIGNSTITLTGGGTVSGPMQITFGSQVTLDNAMLTGAITLDGGSTLTLKQPGNVTTDTSILVGGTIKLDWGTEDGVISADLTEWSGTLEITSGRYNATTSAAHTNLAQETEIVVTGGQFFVAGLVTSANNFTLSGNGWTSTGDPARQGALRIDNGASISGTITLAGDTGVQVYSGTGTLSGAITGNGNTLTKYGAGTLVINNTNLSNLNLTIEKGIVTFGQSQSYALNVVTVKDGATLQDGNLITLSIGELNMENSSTLDLNTGGDSLAAPTLTFKSMNVSGEVTIKNHSNGDLNIAGAIVGAVEGTNTLKFTTGSGLNNLNLQSTISGNLNILKDVNSTLTLSGANTYTGSTTVSAGILKVSGSIAGDDNTYTANGGTIEVTAADASISNSAVKIARNGAANASIQNATVGTSSINVMGTAASKGTLQNAAVTIDAKDGKSNYVISNVTLTNSLVTYESSGKLTLKDITINGTSQVSSTNALSTIELDGGSMTLTAGDVGGNLTLTLGELTLTGEHRSTGTLSIATGQTAQLGTNENSGTWAGRSLAGAGTLKIVNGGLTNAITRTEGSTSSIAIDAGTGTGREISLGGTSASLVSSITLGAGSTLTGITGDIVVGEGGLTSLNLTLTSDNLGREGRAAQAKITQTEGDQLIINAPTNVTLDIDAIVTMLTSDTAKYYLTLTSGDLICSQANLQQMTTLSDTLEKYGIRIDNVDETAGSIVVTASIVTDVYYVTGNTALESYLNPLRIHAGVTISRDQTLTVNLTGGPETTTTGNNGVHVNNLMGGEGSQLIVNNTGDTGSNAVVILNNETINSYGGETKMAGNITGNGGVTFFKTGADKLTVGGLLTTSTLRVEEGTISLEGYDTASQTGSSIDHILLAGNDPQKATLIIGADTVADTLADAEAGGLLTINSGASLSLGENSSISESTIAGNGTLELENKLSLTGSSKLNGVAIALIDDEGFATQGNLDLGTTSNNTVSTLTGTGTLNGSNGSTLTIDGTKKGSFEGTLAGSGTLTVNGSQLQTFKNVTTTSGNWSIQNDKGDLHLYTAKEGGNDALTLSGLQLKKDSTTQFTMNTDTLADDGALITVTGNTGNLTIEQDARITISSTGSLPISPDTLNSLTLIDTTGAQAVQLGEEGTTIEIQLDLKSSTAFKGYDAKAYLVYDEENNRVYIDAQYTDKNLYATYATTPNALAGAELLWNLPEGIAADSVLNDVDQAINTLINSENATPAMQAEAARIMAAAAGSTVASLGMAQKDALRDQMGALRNRLTNMGVDQALVNEDMPYFHMWAQATGNHASLDEKDDESGYTLDTWGATLGFDLDVNEYLTLGAAFTAAYGDLDATGAETATGDLDSYYINLFARAQVKRWTHKLIVSFGINDAKLTRTVDYGIGSYTARGTTNGTGFGAMYELTCDTYLNEERTAVLQPLFNLSVVSTTMDAYSETGEGTAGDAGLDVGKQDMTTGTVALGVRVAGQLSQNVLGRTSFGEFRVNVAQDMGDDRSEASVGFIGAPGMTQRIRGAKEGKTALQIGAGLSIPLAEQSSIFFDANADFRSHASSVNGSVGYRYDF